MLKNKRFGTQSIKSRNQILSEWGFITLLLYLLT